MNFIQTTLQAIQAGKGQFLVRVIPLFATLLIFGGAYNFAVYHGLNDAQSMDNAQLARQIVRKQGFTTEFLRPQAVAQLRDYAASQAAATGRPADLFPPDQFPSGTPRTLPDTYNAPGYPSLLAVWFYFTHPEFDQTTKSLGDTRIYSADRLIPLFNQAFMLLTAVLVFALGLRLFDDRVAWISLLAFLGTDLVWRFSLTALSTTVLMFLVTAMLLCVLEVVCVGEACSENEDRSFAPAWLWPLAAALIFAAACLTRLPLLVLLVPLFFLLIAMPRANFFLYALLALVVIGAVTPWFLHLDKVSGNPLGSNLTLVLNGQGGYTGNQVYCSTSIPSYEQLFRNATQKEMSGFRWHFEHAWELLGANPMILLFGASILHQFKRRRTQLFHWFLFGSAVVIIAMNNLGAATPEPLTQWNSLVVLFPCMVVIGSAYFFILLDRLDIQVRLLHTLIVIFAVIVTMLPLLASFMVALNPTNALPVYWPPAIKAYGQMAEPDEWVTSDIPWATAWYADRPSLWLPDSMTDFETLNEKVCPTGMLLLTPISWAEPFSTFSTGEYKDWYPLVTNGTLPADFPLLAHITPPGGLNYNLWSDRPRWQDAER